MIKTDIANKKILISAVIVLFLALLAFNLEKITGSTIQFEKIKISLSQDGVNFIENPTGNDLILTAGNLLYVKLQPAKDNKRVFIYDPRHSSKASTFETKCLEKSGSNCLSSLAVYKTPVDQWMDGVYTVKIAGVSGKAEFIFENSKYGV